MHKRLLNLVWTLSTFSCEATFALANPQLLPTPPVILDPLVWTILSSSSFLSSAIGTAQLCQRAHPQSKHEMDLVTDAIRLPRTSPS